MKHQIVSKYYHHDCSFWKPKTFSDLMFRKIFIAAQNSSYLPKCLFYLQVELFSLSNGKQRQAIIDQLQPEISEMVTLLHSNMFVYVSFSFLRETYIYYVAWGKGRSVLKKMNVHGSFCPTILINF